MRRFATAESAASATGLKGGNAGLSAPENERVDVGGAFVGVDDFKIHQMADEIKIADDIGAFVVVVHLGKQLDLSLDVALNNMYINLIKVASLVEKNKIKILLETNKDNGGTLNIDQAKDLHKVVPLAEIYTWEFNFWSDV